MKEKEKKVMKKGKENDKKRKRIAVTVLRDDAYLDKSC